MVKSFKTAAVLGVYTGRLLEEGKFGEIHEVMDHFFPGIMTIGLAAMGNISKLEVLKQHPSLHELPECTDKNFRVWLHDALEILPATLPLEGPVTIPEADISKAFEDLGKRVR